MDPRRILARIGLSPKEAQIYLTLLSLGSAHAPELSARAMIARSTTQFVCDQLGRRGIIRQVRRNNVPLYVPEPPEALLLILRRRRQELEEVEEEVQRAMGAFQALVNPGSVLPKVRFFEGRDGFIAAYEEVLREIPPGGETLSFLHPLDTFTDPLSLSASFEGFLARRREKGVRARVIAAESPEARFAARNRLGGLRETRIVAKDTFGPTPGEIIVYGDRTCCSAVERDTLYACVLQSASIARMLRGIFEALWEVAGTRSPTRSRRRPPT